MSVKKRGANASFAAHPRLKISPAEKEVVQRLAVHRQEEMSDDPKSPVSRRRDFKREQEGTRLIEATAPKLQP